MGLRGLIGMDMGLVLIRVGLWFSGVVGCAKKNLPLRGWLGGHLMKVISRDGNRVVVSPGDGLLDYNYAGIARHVIIRGGSDVFVSFRDNVTGRYLYSGRHSADSIILWLPVIDCEHELVITGEAYYDVHMVFQPTGSVMTMIDMQVIRGEPIEKPGFLKSLFG